MTLKSCRDGPPPLFLRHFTVLSQKSPEEGAMMITEQLLTGSAVGESLDDIASLRITIFREFPYLYNGQREEESRYLQVYP
jgi:hypothetical protein